MAGAAALVTLAIGSTAYQVSEADSAKARAENTAAGLKQKSDEMNVDLKNQEATADSNLVRDQARTRQKALAAGAQGRRTTLLTGPLGLSDDANAPKKTLLGT